MLTTASQWHEFSRSGNMIMGCEITPTHTSVVFDGSEIPVTLNFTPTGALTIEEAKAYHAWLGDRIKDAEALANNKHKGRKYEYIKGV